LSPTQHIELINYCNEKGIKFFSTAFDLESIDFLETLKLGLWKVPSGEITNYPYLKRIALKNEPIILSTGMCEMEDIESAVSVFLRFGIKKEQITILHCNTEYPTPMEDVNLKAMKTIADKFGVKVGYSDHTQGIEVPVAAVALGACIIEKHFTLNRNMDGPDHKASLEPDELSAMVKAIRNIEKAIGTEEKKVSISEQKNRSVARKSIVAASEISEGELFTEENITAKRPGTGISPMLWDHIVGKIAKKSYKPDDLIEL
jgi:N,N'-diacetyllegionaminate synthase